MRAFSIMPFNKGVSNIAMNLSGTPKPAPKERQWRAKYTKEQILDMRTKFELEGWTTRQIEIHFNLTQAEAYRYLNYYTARDVIPKRK